MLKVTILAVGTVKDSWIREGISEYAKRLQSYCTFEIIEIPESRLPQQPKEKEIQQGLAKEGELLLGKIPPRSQVFTLCIEGKQQSSQGFAETLDRLSHTSSHLTFIIGSSYGLAPEVKSRGQIRFSLSKMTFPHQLARLFLCEQIYRGLSINHGSKYHK